jgi:fructokinase
MAGARTPLVAGVELGGTKCICILGTGPGDVRDQVRIPTVDPEATLAEIEKVLSGWRRAHHFDSIGIASFGPVGLDAAARDYGFITSTTKPGWRDTDVLSRLAGGFGCPTGFETDVNAAALAEGLWGAARGLSDHAYVTVGTGIGVGVISNGKPLGGFTHSEMGHIRIQREQGDDWPGSCPFHGACVEGLASGTAIKARTGIAGPQLPDDHDIWPRVAFALGQLAHALVLVAAPRRILVGGGVIASRPYLFPMIHESLSRSLNGYGEAGRYCAELTDFLAPPALGKDAGPLGAMALGLRALRMDSSAACARRAEA